MTKTELHLSLTPLHLFIICLLCRHILHIIDLLHGISGLTYLAYASGKRRNNKIQ